MSKKEEKSQTPQANEQGFVGSNPTPRTIDFWLSLLR